MLDNQNETQNQVENPLMEKMGLQQTVTLLRTEANQWKEEVKQTKHRLYDILSACLNLKYFVEQNEDRILALKFMTQDDIKSHEKKVSLRIVSLVFGAKFKKNYTYVKALENAAKLKLQTEENNQLLSTYLKNKGGIDKLIRINTDMIVNDFINDKFGTKEHFGETILDELSKKNDAGLVLKSVKQKLHLDNFSLTDEQAAHFASNDSWLNVGVIKYDGDTKSISILPIIVSQHSEAEYKSIMKVFQNYTAKIFHYGNEDTKHWKEYINLCNERNEKLKAARAEITELANDTK